VPDNRSSRVFTNKPAWYKATTEHISLYKATLRCNLAKMSLPVSVLLCNDFMCKDCQHADILNKYSNDIIQCCLDAAQSSIPSTSPRVDSKTIPGWNEYVAPAREKAIFWHNIWLESGRPHLGIIADIMRRTRAAYHYAIKFVKRNEAELIKQRFVEAISANHSRDFWTEVNRMKSNGSNSVSSVVDGLSDCSEITELFADKYEDLYSCVSYDEGEMMTLRIEIDSMVNSG